LGSIGRRNEIQGQLRQKVKTLCEKKKNTGGVAQETERLRSKHKALKNPRTSKKKKKERKKKA
jgi:hypothetical protein